MVLEHLLRDLIIYYTGIADNIQEKTNKNM